VRVHEPTAGLLSSFFELMIDCYAPHSPFATCTN
jgi:hypothetical protein